MKPDSDKMESGLINKKNLATSNQDKDDEFCRICPSKLTKHELENLYYDLLKSNCQLKKTIDKQAERIKSLLNIKHARDSAPKVLQADERKDCCINTKCLVHQQKQTVISLKRENERLTERIRILNKKLSSFKQFNNVPVPSCRRPSIPTAAINKEAIRDNEMRSVDLQTDPPVEIDPKSLGVQTELEKEFRVCDENKCRNQMCELQETIVMLREELHNTHKEYINRISRLEEQVLHNSSQKVGNNSQEALSGHEKQINHLMNNLKAAGELSNELKMQLSVEKMKVTDLVKQIKDIGPSNRMTSNKDTAINTVELESFETEPTWNGGGKCSCPRLSPRRISRSIHLYRQGLSLDHERCSKCCEELQLYKKNCGDAIKRSSFTECGPSNIVGLNQLNTNQNQLEAKSLNKSNKKEDFSISNEYQISPISKSTISSPKLSVHEIHKTDKIHRIDTITVSPDSIYNNALNIGTECSGKIIFTINDDLDNAGRQLKESNTSKNISKANDCTEEQNVNFNATKNETLDSRVGNSLTLAQNECLVPKHQDRGISPIDFPSSNETRINQSVKIVPANCSERSAPRNNLSTDNNEKKTRSQNIEGMRPPKSDQHNSLQIPGPIPMSESSANRNGKINIYKQLKEEINGRRNKAQNSKCKEIPNHFSKSLEKVELNKESLPEAVEKTTQISEKDLKATASPLCKLNKIEGKNNSESNIRVTVDKKEYNKITEKHIPCTSKTVDKNAIKNDLKMGPKGAKTLVVRRNSMVPSQIQHAVATYRRKSGTLCFKTVPTNNVQRFHNCKCNAQKPCGGLVNKGVQSDEISEKTLIQEQGVCLTECPECSRDTVNVSTVLEKSFKVESIEEHEDKNTTFLTNTSNCEDVLTSFDAVKDQPYGKSKTQENFSNSTSGVSQYNMHEKLNSIAEELENCKRLMQTLPSNREHSQDNRLRETLNWDQAHSQLTLKEGVATHNLCDAAAPRCVFTLHIGTVVLSDEAVLNSRHKSLIVTWKFFDQNVSMSRMPTGRVVLYDFSTEYNILLTNDFLNYMKHEEMPIIICEWDKLEEPYARCALPLREALLNINMRADMSLALVAGPQMIYARSKNNQDSDHLDTSDEMGVMDVWCMLQAADELIPVINRTIMTPSPIQSLWHTKDESHVMLQVQPQNEIVVAKQEDFLHRRNLTSNKTTSTDIKPKGYMQEENNFDKHMSLSKRQNSSVLRLPNTVAIDRGADYPRRDSLHVSGCYRDSDNRQTKNPTSLLHEHGDSESRIIINEVIPNIKTSADLKEAMIAKNRSSLHNISKIPKQEEGIIYQARSSNNNTSPYFRNVFGKLQRKDHNKIASKDQHASFNKNTKSAEQELEPMVLLPVESDDEYDNITKKYDNIAKLCAYKTDQSKKSVTITSNRRRESAESIEEEPQKDISNTINENDSQTISITILWLALNEKCEAMSDPRIQRVYIAYSFLGRSGADLETPVSLPKPKNYVDKVYFNFKKSFHLEDEDIPLLGHMARCRSVSLSTIEPERDCLLFSVISEPPDDTLSLESCEDIGYAYIFLGDLLAYSIGSNCYTEVAPVRAKNGSSVCGVLAVRFDGLDTLRRCIQMTGLENDITIF